MDRPGDQFLARSAFTEDQHVGIGGGYHFHLTEDALESGTPAENLAKRSGGFHLRAKVVALLLQLTAQRFVFLEGSRIGNRHGSRVGHGSQPGPAIGVRLGAPEDCQHAHHLAPKHQRVTGEAHQAFRLRPLRVSNPLAILGQARNENGFAGSADVRNFQIAGR